MDFAKTQSDIAWPNKTRELQNFLMDSTRWNDFRFRDDDIVVATWSKSGTTWTQQIVAQMIFDGSDTVFGQAESPWIDFQLTPDAPAQAEAQKRRRFMKTHLPIDALVFSPKAKYIYVGRDARDVAWSFHHHMTHMSGALEAFGEVMHRTNIAPPPPIPADVREFYLGWLEFGAEGEAAFWDNVRGWWNARHLPNVLIVHYNNLKNDLPGQFMRIANFLDIEIDPAKLPRMLRHCGIEHMKERAANVEWLEKMFDGGGRTFVHKGTNGRWKDVLTPAEITRCDEVAAKYLMPDCAHWLKIGEMPD